MSDDNSTDRQFNARLNELISILRKHDVHSEPIASFMQRHHGTGYFADIQDILDVKELLDVGLIRAPIGDYDDVGPADARVPQRVHRDRSYAGAGEAPP
jgi:hypothetical protein